MWKVFVQSGTKWITSHLPFLLFCLFIFIFSYNSYFNEVSTSRINLYNFKIPAFIVKATILKVLCFQTFCLKFYNIFPGNSFYLFVISFIPWFCFLCVLYCTTQRSYWLQRILSSTDWFTGQQVSFTFYFMLLNLKVHHWMCFFLV